MFSSSSNPIDSKRFVRNVLDLLWSEGMQRTTISSFHFFVSDDTANVTLLCSPILTPRTHRRRLGPCGYSIPRGPTPRWLGRYSGGDQRTGSCPAQLLCPLILESLAAILSQPRRQRPATTKRSHPHASNLCATSAQWNTCPHHNPGNTTCNKYFTCNNFFWVTYTRHCSMYMYYNLLHCII